MRAREGDNALKIPLTHHRVVEEAVKDAVHDSVADEQKDDLGMKTVLLREDPRNSSALTSELAEAREGGRALELLLVHVRIAEEAVGDANLDRVAGV